MDFASWSPSHTILVLVVIIGFIGQVAVFFYRTAQNDKRIDEVKTEIKEVRSDMNQRLSDMQGEIRDVRLELSKLNQNHIDHLTHHN